MNKIKKSIMDLYNSLSSKQKLVVLIVFVSIMALIYFNFIKNDYKGDDIDYRKISIESLIESSEVVYDRDLIMSIDKCVNNILKVNNESLIMNNRKVKVRNLYDELVSNNYKKSLSYSKFKNKMNQFYQNVLNDEGYIDGKNYIDTVLYSSKNNMYLIKLGEISYIGIIINDFSYTIGYIE